MKKRVALLVVCILLLLCACNTEKDDSQNENALNETEIVEPVLNNDSEEVKNKLLGTWENEYWEHVLCFIDYETCIEIQVSDSSENYELEIMDATYEVIDEDTMICTSADGYSERYTFSVSENELDFNQEGHEDFFVNHTMTRVNDQEEYGYSVVGNWKLLSNNAEVAIMLNSRTTPINNLVFYNDCSYTIKSEYPRNGKYEVVHDGNTVCLDGEYYWDIEFPCIGVMLLTTEGGTTWLYVRQ
ncbi:MAG: hypothetical protein J6C98_01495 [Oscillospiraceae bacterium]|nr:hypothetical protein [Oscillospiraceae bacterium]